MPTAADVVERLNAVNLADRRIDHAATERALERHLKAAGLTMRPVNWCRSPNAAEAALRAAPPLDGAWIDAYRQASAATKADASADYDDALRAWEAGLTAGMRAVQRECLHDMYFFPPSGDGLTDVLYGAARAVAALAAYDVRRRPCQQQLVELMLPFVDMFEVGLSRFWVTHDTVVCMEAPYRLRTEPRLARSRHLHCADGPAVAWRDGFAYWYWHGMVVSQNVVEAPHTITGEEIDRVRNAEVRRVMIERLGLDAYLPRSGAVLVHEDETGRLWRKQYPTGDGSEMDEHRADGHVLAIVEVVNGTPEPDGTYKTYFLRVPARMATAREAVAWTYGLTAEEYTDVIRT